ncbi:hypothetical protein BDZ89DRAFT_1070265 [Hymenopellis radicata]|nr:hypothetical protein BDZ89DRAFT_1070265 [Hymenopellis radicata]
MGQPARQRALIPSWNLDEQIVKRSRFSSTACLPAPCQPPIATPRRFASDPGPRRHKPKPVESWTSPFKRGSRSCRHRTREARVRARMRRLEYSVSMGMGSVGDRRVGCVGDKGDDERQSCMGDRRCEVDGAGCMGDRRCEVDDDAEERRRREEAFERNEDALAQLQSLLDMLSTTPKDEGCKAVRDEDFIHPVIFAGVVFLIMIILLNLPAYVQPSFIFLGYSN